MENFHIVVLIKVSCLTGTSFIFNVDSRAAYNHCCKAFELSSFDPTEPLTVIYYLLFIMLYRVTPAIIKNTYW